MMLLADRLVLDQSVILKAGRHLMKNDNPTNRLAHGQVLQPHRARPEAHTCGVAKIVKDSAINITLRLAIVRFRSRRNIIDLIRGSLGLAQKDLIEFIGSASKVSEVLNGKRPLSINMIRKLHAGLKIPTDILIRQSDLMADVKHLKKLEQSDAAGI